MFRRILDGLLGRRDILLPSEYGPWIQDVVPLMRHCFSAVKRKEINKDENGNLRILVTLFMLGIIDFYGERNRLTYGQHRYLFIAAGQKLGMKYDALSVADDIRDNVERIDPELVPLATDALEAGYRMGREYFTAGDTRGNFLLSAKLLQWSDPSYKAPQQPKRKYHASIAHD